MITWYLRQLLPLKYTTTYEQGGKIHYSEWRMWFGHCFNVHDHIVNVDNLVFDKD